MSCKECFLAVVDKLLQKSPLNYTLVKNLSFLDPTKMAEKTAVRLCTGELRKALGYLVEQGRVKEQDCDNILFQYTSFVDDVVQKNHSVFADFNQLSDRVDTFLHRYISKDRQYEKLWKGFLVNWQIEVENLSEENYRAQITIADHLRVVGGIQNVVVDKELLLSVRHQDFDQRTQSEGQQRGQKPKVLLEEIEDSKKSKKKRLENNVQALTSSANRYALKAESEGKLNMIAKSNSLRQEAKEKTEAVKEVDRLLNEKLLL
ncbi:hypothetical protein N1851_031497 [Merluccius polli]|uniref:Uncharacterized protein n=1 Tax=Merluccius polli TaxID=89951 RepID=A0AA47NP63_MERPO|nr:hypothetical protein N1851_031497 [Merluccius polli]